MREEKGHPEPAGEPHLPLVRRFEAAGFRAWPAASVSYDGSWLIRLTAGHPGRRLNSVNPLDPDDHDCIGERLAVAARRFDAYGRPLTVRVSPLTARQICQFLDGEGWRVHSQSLVMAADMDQLPIAGAVDQIPMKDIGRFVGSLLAIRGFDRSMKAGFSEMLGSIVADAGLFVLEKKGQAVSTAICVHDHDLAGLFEIATDRRHRRRGHGHQLLLSALRWAGLLGAKRAWLQVEAANGPAVQLYASLGFREVYRYHYRQPPS